MSCPAGWFVSYPYRVCVSHLSLWLPCPFHALSLHLRHPLEKAITIVIFRSTPCTTSSRVQLPASSPTALRRSVERRSVSRIASYEGHRNGGDRGSGGGGGAGHGVGRDNSRAVPWQLPRPPPTLSPPGAAATRPSTNAYYRNIRRRCLRSGEDSDLTEITADEMILIGRRAKIITRSFRQR